MGFDLVEIVMAIEDEFQISFTDAEAEQADTVGKVVNLIHGRLRQNQYQPCPSQHGFYVVRKQLMSMFELPRSAIVPQTRLEEIIPRKHRRRLWKKFCRALCEKGDIIKPVFIRPRFIKIIFFYLLPAITFLLFFQKLLLLAILPAICVAVLGALLTIPFKTEFSSTFSYVKDLVGCVGTLDCRIWSRQEVFEKVRDISVEILNVKPEYITLDAHWVNDLGAD